ncbi:hypothetical protein HID58_002784 [Brassica napus]|uniref:Uncharacterized protein n=1 Tax=Brassica napus TaxID=3708 RepID=A0ABQ8EPB4_BRANA|nr:hypothetical protein HID58_002784 [Brassica napus]
MLFFNGIGAGQVLGSKKRGDYTTASWEAVALGRSSSDEIHHANFKSSKRLKGIICLSKPSVFFHSCFTKNNCVLILLILYLSISWLKDMSQIHFLNI